jgi:hypothetical protein
MPNIPQYNESIGRLQPQEGGQEARVMEGRHIAAEYNEAGQRAGSALAHVGEQIGGELNKRQVQGETLQAHADMAGMYADALNQYDAITRDPNHDPNDQSKAQEVMQQFNDRFDSYVQSMSNTDASERATAAADQYKQTFANHVRGTEAGIAGERDVQNYTKLENSLGAAAAAHPEQAPTLAGQLMDSMGHYTENSVAGAEHTSRLLATAKDEGVGNIAKAAAIGTINQAADPVAAVDELRGNKFYQDNLKPGDWETLANHAKGTQEYNDHLTNAQRLQQERDQKDELGGALNKSLLDAVNQDGTIDGAKLLSSTRQLAQLPGARLEPETIKATTELAVRASKPEATPFRSTPGAASKYLDAIANGTPPTDAEVLRHTLVPGGLTLEESNFVRERAKDTPANRFEVDNISAAKKSVFATINPVGTASGYRAYQRFDAWFNKTYQDKRKAGMSDDQLLNPDSKDYMLTDQQLAKFKASSDDLIPAPPKEGTSRPSLNDLIKGTFGGE